MLSAGSSTLRKLLEKGQSSGSLRMEDLEDAIVSRLLLFLHTDSLGDINWKTATKLYNAAFTYQIERLKIKCSCFFLENLETHNAANILKLAHEHEDAQLRSLVEDAVFLRYKKMTVSKIWAEFYKTDNPKCIETKHLKRLKSGNNK